MEIKLVPIETAIYYVAGAYIGIWVILFGYLVSLNGRLSNLRRQVEALTTAVERGDVRQDSHFSETAAPQA